MAHEEQITRPPLHQAIVIQTSPEATQKKEHEMFIKFADLKEKMYSDQAGTIPYLSSKGMRYIMIVYYTNAN